MTRPTTRANKQGVQPMPSPRKTNKARLWLLKVPTAADPRLPLAHDELPPNGFAETRADLVDASKMRGTGEDEAEQGIANLARFLKAKGLSSDDIRQACDAVRLGIGKSSRFGGAFNQNFAGNLHGEVTQQPRQPLSDPGARDQPPCLEELLGQEPWKGDRDIGRDSRMGFDQVYGLLPVIESMQPRRPVTDRALALDAANVDSFNARFPSAVRIKPAY